MRPKNQWVLIVLGLIAVLIWMIPGCSDDDEVITDNGGDADCDSAAALIVIANDSLASQMDDVINVTLDNPDSSFRPREVDFSGLNELYEQAVTLCPTNPDAQFGSAFTGLMIYLADTALNNLIDRIKYAADTISYGSKVAPPLKMFPTIVDGRKLTPDGIPMTANGFVDILPSLVSLDFAIMDAAPDDPQISEIQDHFESQLLPKIANARIRLANILNDANYTFVITPEMQGNSGADSIVIDRTDFSVFLAVAYAAEAAIHIFLARDLDIYPYSIASVETALNSGSSFLNLRPGNHMDSAKVKILAAKDAVINAIDYLIAEIGTDQSYDLIEIPSGGLADLNEANDTIDYYFTYFDAPKDLDIIWTDHWIWIDDPYGGHSEAVKETLSVNVDISQFFDNPMNNPKNFLPGYTVSLTDLDSLMGACYEWTDDTFETWDWPDPTFNGLLPNMTDAMLREHLLDDGSSWIKSDCDTVDID